MNEDLLQHIYQKYHLDQKGDFETFKNDMRNPDVQRHVFDTYLSDKGDFETFQKDLASQPSDEGMSHSPKYGIVSKYDKDQIEKNAVSKVDKVNAELKKGVSQAIGTPAPYMSYDQTYKEHGLDHDSKLKRLQKARMDELRKLNVNPNDLSYDELEDIVKPGQRKITEDEAKYLKEQEDNFTDKEGKVNTSLARRKNTFELILGGLENVSPAGIRKLLGQEGIVDTARRLFGKKMTKEDILNAQPGDIYDDTETGNEKLLRLKQYVYAEDLKNVELDIEKLNTYAEYSKKYYDSLIPPAVNDAVQTIADAEHKRKIGKLTQEDYNAAVHAHEYLQNLPEDIKSLVKEQGDVDQKVSEDYKKIAKEHPAGDIVLKLNEVNQQVTDKSRKNRSAFLNGVRDVAGAFGEFVPRLTYDLNSTVDSALNVLGSENAKADLIRESDEFYQRGTYRDSSKARRPINERTYTNFEYKGKIYDIGFDEGGNITNIYTDDGYVAYMDDRTRQAIYSKIEDDPSYFDKSKSRINWSAGFNAIVDGGSDLLGTIALSYLTGGLGALGGASRTAASLREAIPVLFQYTGRMTAEGISQGLTPEQAAVYGLFNGAGEAASEALFPTFGRLTGRVPGVRISSVEKMLKRLGAKNPTEMLAKVRKQEYIKTLLSVPGQEGLEEAVMTIGQPLINRALNSLMDVNLDGDMPEFRDYVTDFSIGAAISVIPGVVGATTRSNYLRKNGLIPETVYGLMQHKDKAIEMADKFAETIGPEYAGLGKKLQDVYNSTVDYEGEDRLISDLLADKNVPEEKKIESVASAWNEVTRNTNEPGTPEVTIPEDEDTNEKLVSYAKKVMADENKPDEPPAPPPAPAAVLEPPAPVTKKPTYRKDFEGDVINYGGIKGKLVKGTKWTDGKLVEDPEGDYYVVDEKGQATMVEGGLSESSNEELGISLIRKSGKTEKTIRSVKYDPETESFSIAGNSYKIERENKTKKGISLTMRDNDGRKITVRNPELIAKIKTEQLKQSHDFNEQDNDRLEEQRSEALAEALPTTKRGRGRPRGTQPTESTQVSGSTAEDTGERSVKDTIESERRESRSIDDQLIKIYDEVFPKIKAAQSQFIESKNSFLDEVFNIQKIANKKAAVKAFGNSISNGRFRDALKKIIGEDIIDEVKKLNDRRIELGRRTTPSEIKARIYAENKADAERQAAERKAKEDAIRAREGKTVEKKPEPERRPTISARPKSTQRLKRDERLEVVRGSILSQGTDFFGDEKPNWMLTQEEATATALSNRKGLAKSFHRQDVQRAIDDGKYLKAIKEGRMTAQDAKTIIGSTGIPIPDIINEKVKDQKRLLREEARKNAPEEVDVVPVEEPQDIPTTTPIGKTETISEKESKKPVSTTGQVIYSGYFINDPKALEEKFPSKLPNKYYHHATKSYKPENLDVAPGEEKKLVVIGRITTDKVDVLILPGTQPNGTPMHIILATAEGVKPVESGIVAKQEIESSRFKPFNTPVDVLATEGYYDGENVITTDNIIVKKVKVEEEKVEGPKPVVEEKNKDIKFMRLGNETKRVTVLSEADHNSQVRLDDGTIAFVRNEELHTTQEKADKAKEPKLKKESAKNINLTVILAREFPGDEVNKEILQPNRTMEPQYGLVVGDSITNRKGKKYVVTGFTQGKVIIADNLDGYVVENKYDPNKELVQAILAEKNTGGVNIKASRTEFGQSGLAKEPFMDRAGSGTQVRRVNPYKSLKNKIFTFIFPDDLFTGILTLNGRPIMQGFGGMFYTAKYGEKGYAWATVGKIAAKGLVDHANDSLKKNKGKGYIVLVKGQDTKHRSSLQGKMGFLRTILEYTQTHGHNQRNILKTISKYYNIGMAKNATEAIRNIDHYLETGRGMMGGNLVESKNTFENLMSELARTDDGTLRDMAVAMGIEGALNVQGTAITVGGFKNLYDTMLREDVLANVPSGHAYAAIKFTSELIFEFDPEHPSYPYVIKTKDGSPVELEVFEKTFRAYGKDNATDNKKTKEFGSASSTLAEHRLRPEAEGNPSEVDLKDAYDLYNGLKETSNPSDELTPISTPLIGFNVRSVTPLVETPKKGDILVYGGQDYRVTGVGDNTVNLSGATFKGTVKNVPINAIEGKVELKINASLGATLYPGKNGEFIKQLSIALNRLYNSKTLSNEDLELAYEIVNVANKTRDVKDIHLAQQVLGDLLKKGHEVASERVIRFTPSQAIQSGKLKDMLKDIKPTLGVGQKIILDILKTLDVNVHVVPETFFTIANGYYIHNYDRGAHTILLPEDFTTSTLIHEGIHALTTAMYDKNEEFKADFDKFFYGLKSLLKDGNVKGINELITDEYGFSMPEEFLTELFSNPQFANSVGNIPVRDIPKKKYTGVTVIDYVINMIVYHLGKKETVSEYWANFIKKNQDEFVGTMKFYFNNLKDGFDIPGVEPNASRTRFASSLNTMFRDLFSRRAKESLDLTPEEEKIITPEPLTQRFLTKSSLLIATVAINNESGIKLTPEEIFAKSKSLYELHDITVEDIRNVIEPPATRLLNVLPEEIYNPIVTRLSKTIRKLFNKSSGSIVLLSGDAWKDTLKNALRDKNAKFQVGGLSTESNFITKPLEKGEVTKGGITSAEEKHMFIGDNGEYLFFHYGSGLKGGVVDARKGKRKPYTTDVRFNTTNYYYTNPKTKEGMVGGLVHVVSVPRDKVYNFNSDPLNLYEEARANFKKQFPNGQFSADKQIDFMLPLIHGRGFKMVVAKHPSMPLRAETLQPLPINNEYTTRLRVNGGLDRESQLKTMENAAHNILSSIANSPGGIKSGVNEKYYSKKWKLQDIINDPLLSKQLSMKFKYEYLALINPSFMTNLNGDIYGFELNGTVYLNADNINANTPIHELGHIWLKWAFNNRPDLYNVGLEKVKGSRYVIEAKANKFYQERSKNLPKSEVETFFLEEALAAAIGDQGEALVEGARKSDFKQWLSELWKAVREYFGLEKFSPTEIAKMSLDEFSKRIAADLLNDESDSSSVSEEEVKILSKEEIENYSPEIQEFMSESTLPTALSKPGYAILNATDPNKPDPNSSENIENNKRLKAELIDRFGEKNVLEVGGAYMGIPQGVSFIVTGISERKARKLGQKYGQESILTNKGFIYTTGENVGKYTPYVGKVKFGEEARKADGFTIVGGLKIIYFSMVFAEDNKALDSPPLKEKEKKIPQTQAEKEMKAAPGMGGERSVIQEAASFKTNNEVMEEIRQRMFQFYPASARPARSPRTREKIIREAARDIITTDGTFSKEIDIANRVLGDREIIHDVEVVALGYAIMRLQDVFDRQAAIWAKAEESNDPKAADYYIDMNATARLLDKFRRAVTETGTEASDAMRIRSEILKEDMFTEEGVIRDLLALHAKKGIKKPILSDDEKTLRKMARERYKLLQKVKDLKAELKLKGKEAKNAIFESAIRDIKRKIDPKQAEKNRIKLTKNFNEALQNMEDVLSGKICD